MVQAELDIEMPLLLEAIYAKYHQDFRHYAPSSLKRRLADALRRLRVRSLSGLQELVLHDANAWSDLLALLTVQVSAVFRDPAFFRALREHVVPWLRTRPSFKVWVPGCSTGEEVYSLAILLREEGILGNALIYATDIAPTALAAAEQGIYPLDRMADFSRAYLAAGGRGSLSDYYAVGYGAAIVDRSLRRGIVFAEHSLATDAVFAEVELVSCRNVLIYFDKTLQNRTLGLCADALVSGGFLGLGAKETLRFSKHAAAFAEHVREQRIYRKR
jgi:chemotaxis protein methyltransferase CheR